jgi:hypothetical protein
MKVKIFNIPFCYSDEGEKRINAFMKDKDIKYVFQSSVHGFTQTIISIWYTEQNMS